MKKTNHLKGIKNFILHGNVREAVIGFTVGVAFKDTVNSLVNDIIMPPIGLLLGDTDFNSLYVNLGSETYTNLNAAIEANAPIIRYGAFINELIELAIIGISIYILLRIIFKKKEEEEKQKEIKQA